jgi:hypothetical protein
LLITGMLPGDDPPEWLVWVVFVSIPLMLLFWRGLTLTPWALTRRAARAERQTTPSTGCARRLEASNRMRDEHLRRQREERRRDDE